jgi:alpha-D-ribose 1-methylphosphonate 5-triphosphate diphosphatase PhnM
MAAEHPLQGAELIDCAKASAPQGLETAAEQCGYGNDTAKFEQAVKQACRDRGIEIAQLDDLVSEQQQVRQHSGVEIAPDSGSDL